MTVVFWIAIVFGFYMAWSIGANDAANAMGTSVGSKAVSFKEAVIIAAIFEFSGAFIAGAGVTDTLRKGIIDPAAFSTMANGGEIFTLGMLAALIAAAVWIHAAAYLGWPVSTTHSIVGAITGFGIVTLGASQIKWGKVVFIVASWVTSPILGGLIAFLVFMAIRKFILDKDDKIGAARIWAPVFSFPVFLVLALVLFFKGLKNFQIKQKLADGTVEKVFAFGKDAAGEPLFLVDTFMAFGLAVGFGILATIVMGIVMKRIDLSVSEEAQGNPELREEEEIAVVERVYRYLQVLTACFVAFAHGSNDVANSIGPLAAIAGMYNITTMEFIGEIQAKVPVPTWVLLLGAVGIVIGLASFGWKVIETVGTKITEITPSRGFAAEFGAATTILIGSQLGLPLSTTHTIVGAVIGVGFARGMNALNLGVVWSIIKSWVYTIPFTAIVTILLFYILKAIFI